MKSIIRLSRVDLITVCGLLLALSSAILSIKGALMYGLMALMLAMLCDAHDGYWARRLHLKSPFGPALDSLVDVIMYLVTPSLYLYFGGLQSSIHLLAYACLIVCGILRLAVFTTNGFDEVSGGGLYYRGLPVFWVPFWVLIWTILSPWIPAFVPYWGIPLTAIGIAVAMLWDHRQFKPRNITRITTVLITIVMGLSLIQFHEALRRIYTQPIIKQERKIDLVTAQYAPVTVLKSEGHSGTGI